MLTRRRLAVLLAVTLCAGFVLGSAGALADPAAGPATNIETTNETAPHENPDEINDDGDLRRVEQVLAGGMGGLLEDSAISLSDEQYEQGRELLGDEYDDLLGKYVTNAPDVDEEETAETFSDTRDEQSSYTDSVEEFEETKTEYEEAVAEGDEERARELARELLDMADQIDEQGDRLLQLYDQLESQTGLNFTDAQASIQTVRESVLTDAESIEADEFIETTLTAETNRTAVSFTDPAGVAGELRTAEGEPIGDATIVVRAGADAVQITTDADGSFETTYRPTLVSLNQSSLSVEYAPDPTDPFRASTETLNLTIDEQANSTVTLDTTTDNAAFGDTVRASGTVRVADRPPMTALPVSLTVGGEPLATGETDPTGEFDLRDELPATIPDGDVALAVGVDLDETAVGGSISTAEITIEPTETDLTLQSPSGDGDEADDIVTADAVEVSGQLTTPAGDGVPNRSIVVFADETRLGTLETTDNGAYTGTFDVSSVASPGDEIEIRTAFEGTGTNLEPSGAERAITLPEEDAAAAADADDGYLLFTDLLTILTGLLGFVAIMLVGLFLLQSRLTARRPPLDRLQPHVPDALWSTVAGVSQRLRTLLSPLTAQLHRLAAPLITILRNRGILADPSTESAATAETTATATGTPVESNADAAATDVQSAPDTSTTPTPFAQARSALEGGQCNEAIGLAYTTVRSRLEAEVDPEPADTHWEFYRRCTSVESVNTDPIQRLTEAYETATFAPTDVSQSVAADALADAAAALESTSTPPKSESVGVGDD